MRVAVPENGDALPLGVALCVDGDDSVEFVRWIAPLVPLGDGARLPLMGASGGNPLRVPRRGCVPFIGSE